MKCYITQLAERARNASRALARLKAEEKNAALMQLAEALTVAREEIIAANARDLENARSAGLSEAMLDRLMLTEARFSAMIAGLEHVATLEDPVGETIWSRKRPSGITIDKVRVPFGVIAVVFESRPNVFIDTAALCLKTGNAVILRGGKEAFATNLALARVVRRALSEGKFAPIADAVQFVERLEHEGVTELVRAVGLVDLAIPRGGERLIRAMCEAALVPVLKHYKGVCHIYVDREADPKMALEILDNAKTQRPGVCNAAECLLVDKTIAEAFLPQVENWAKSKGVKLHFPSLNESVETESAWEREFLTLEMNVGVVEGVSAAIEHINRFGSHHSDAIVTDNAIAASRFLQEVDSACVYHNASTRFTDGSEFGMGAEIGISTDKLHARGPMGLEELTTYKYHIHGTGTIRG